MVMMKLGRLFRGNKGQGMTEYIIIVALIAIAAIAIFTLFGDQIRSVMSGMGGQLSGDTAAETESFQSDMDDQRDKDVTMGEFGNE